MQSIRFWSHIRKGKNGFWTSRLAISCQKAVGAKATPSELTPNVLYLPLPPKLSAVPEGKQTVKWASKTAQGVSERCGPFSWLQPGYRSGLKKISFVTPSAVSTQCIKRGLQPLRQTRWHLSQVQNLFLELFVVKLQSALELSTQSLPAHKCPPIARPVWLTGMWSFFGRNSPERADRVQGPLLVCQRLSRQSDVALCPRLLTVQ